jgi:hypothetical protein
MGTSLKPKPVTLELRGRELWMSWRKPLNVDPSAPRIGTWVEWYVDTAVGAYVESRGSSGAVRIGARNR